MEAIDTFGSRFDTVLYVGSYLLCNEPAPAGRCSDDFDGIRSLVALDSLGALTLEAGIELTGAVLSIARY